MALRKRSSSTPLPRFSLPTYLPSFNKRESALSFSISNRTRLSKTQSSCSDSQILQITRSKLSVCIVAFASSKYHVNCRFLVFSPDLFAHRPQEKILPNLLRLWRHMLTSSLKHTLPCFATAFLIPKGNSSSKKLRAKLGLVQTRAPRLFCSS
jgi:hypothetical protein